MDTQPWSDKIWFSPCYVINQLATTMMKGTGIKQHREAWICAVAFICHSSISKKEWWIQIPKDDPPDVLAMELIENPDGKGQTLSVVNVEVFEISAHDSTESIFQSIKRKIGDKDYSNMTLIGFIRRKELFDHSNLAEKVHKLSPNVQNLWLIAREEHNTNTSFISVFPELLKFKADFGMWCRNSDQRDVMSVARGMGSNRISFDSSEGYTLVPSSH